MDVIWFWKIICSGITLLSYLLLNANAAESNCEAICRFNKDGQADSTCLLKQLDKDVCSTHFSDHAVQTSNDIHHDVCSTTPSPGLDIFWKTSDVARPSIQKNPYFLVKLRLQQLPVWNRDVIACYNISITDNGNVVLHFNRSCIAQYDVFISVVVTNASASGISTNFTWLKDQSIECMPQSPACSDWNPKVFYEMDKRKQEFYVRVATNHSAARYVIRAIKQTDNRTIDRDCAPDKRHNHSNYIEICQKNFPLKKGDYKIKVIPTQPQFNACRVLETQAFTLDFDTGPAAVRFSHAQGLEENNIVLPVVIALLSVIIIVLLILCQVFRKRKIDGCRRCKGREKSKIYIPSIEMEDRDGSSEVKPFTDEY